MENVFFQSHSGGLKRGIPQDIHILILITYMDVLSYNITGTLQMLLRILTWGLSLIIWWAQCNHREPEGARRIRVRERKWKDRNRNRSDMLWRWRKGPLAKECRWSLEAEKARKHSPLGPPEEAKPCQHLEFSTVKMISDFSLPEL